METRYRPPQTAVSDAYDLAQLFRRRTGRHDDSAAYMFLSGPEGETERVLSYRQLADGAFAVAASLRPVQASGHPVVLAYPAGLDFVFGFWGCVLSGCIAVPVALPDGHTHSKEERLRAILRDASPRAILTSGSGHLVLSELLGEHALPELIRTDVLEPSDDLGPAPSLPTTAYLQYTSGSTGAPRGVIVSHTNALANCAFLHSNCGFAHDSVLVNWVPPFHDQGLIYGVVAPIYGGFPAVHLSPRAFVETPKRWLSAISRFGATHAGGPNFCYELCVRKVDPDDRYGLDLSGWRVAYNAAEPVRASTLRSFLDAFAPYGFSSRAFQACYGLAEATLRVAAAPVGKGFEAVSLDAAALRRGVAVDARDMDPDFPALEFVAHGSMAYVNRQIHIVDPDSRGLCRENDIGEIWVAGPDIATGYWNQPDITADLFQARLIPDDGNCYLRTGDLGFHRHNTLYLCGRLKDLIIIRGANIHPSDIENTAEGASSLVRPGACVAFSIDRDGEERLCVVAETSSPINASENIESIVAAISRQHGLNADVVLVSPHSIPKTTSGKLQRSIAKQKYLDQGFDVIAESRRVNTPLLSISSESDWLFRLVSTHLGIDPDYFDPSKPFAEYGLDSVGALSLLKDLSDNVGGSVSPAVLWDYPTAEKLRDFLSGKARTIKQRANSQSQNQNAWAIVGMACRFPQASCLEKFWELLVGGRDAITQVPSDRWKLDRWYSPTPHHQGRTVSKWGGFIDGVSMFDRTLFGMSAEAARFTDPQQRLLLEMSWEALEDARIAPTDLAGTNTGVFVGITQHDYGRLILGHTDRSSPYAAAGASLAIAANRISYTLDLRGPSVAIDTACSSSLVALHHATRALRDREIDLAIVGGANLLLTPEKTVALSQGTFLSPEGRCRAFDSAANGYVRGEGVGVVILKPLNQAERDRDRIYAIVVGTAVNQDGRTNGLTAPNGIAQQEVIQTARECAGVTASQIDYVEAHGTGTALGDVIEAEAIGASMTNRPADRPCSIGSVKTNIGHLEAAAGIAGMIKVALCLHHRILVPSLHFSSPNPHISFERLRIAVQTSTESWKADGTRYAGVSSFGFGGTNAHAILRDSSSQSSFEDNSSVTRRPHLLLLSAADQPALKELAGRYRSLIRDVDAESLGDICYSAAATRAHLRERLAIVAADSGEMSTALSGFIEGLHHGGVYRPGQLGNDKSSGSPADEIDSFARDYVAGAKRDWGATFTDKRRRVSLPKYPFQRARYWLDTSLRRELSSPSYHPILDDCGLKQIRIALANLPPYLLEHRVGGKSAFPAAGYLELALACGHERFAGAAIALTDAKFSKLLALDGTGVSHVTIALSAVHDKLDLRVLSNDDLTGSPFDEYASVQVTGLAHEEPSEVFPAFNDSELQDCSPETFYDNRRRGGIDYGPSFRLITQLSVGKDTAVAKVDASGLLVDGYVIHPALLDSILQVSSAATGDTPPSPLVPVSLQRLVLLKPLGGRVTCRAVTRALPGGGVTCDFQVFDQYGEIALTIEGYVKRPLSLVVNPETLPLWRVKWVKSVAAPPRKGTSRRWALIGDKQLGRQLVESLEQAGDAASVVSSLADLERQLKTSEKPDGIVSMFGLGSKVGLQPDPMFFDINKHTSDTLALVQLLLRCDWHPTERLWFVTRGAQPVEGNSVPRIEQSPLWGFARVVAREQCELRSAIVDLAPLPMREEAGILAAELIASCDDDQVAFRSAGRFVPRVAKYVEGLPPQPFGAVVGAPGDLSSVRYAEAANESPGPGEIKIAVVAASINFRDVLIAMGTYSGDAALGSDVAGVVTAIGQGVHFMIGDRVVANVSGGIASHVICSAIRAVRIPASIGFCDAAAIPVAMLTAEYVLANLIPCEPGNRILVHAASGGTGLALVQVAKRLGLDVLATAGSSSKRAFLSSIGVQLVGSSRDHGFVDSVHAVTGGQGVDIAINTLGADFVRPTLSTITHGGHFVELGRDREATSQLENQARTDVGRHRVFLPDLWQLNPNLMHSILLELIARFEQSVYSPLPTTCLPFGDVASALDQIRSAGHVGKLVLHRQTRLSAPIAPDATYLITGAFGALGKQVARWCAKQGAKFIALLARSDDDGQLVDELTRQGAQVLSLRCDASDAAAVRDSLELVRRQFPPMKGVIHCAGSIADGLIPRQTASDVASVIESKAKSAWLLHQMTEDDDLDSFVVFSSIAAVAGTAGQSNYAAANAFLDALCHYRRSKGLPATSIGWSAWAGDGMARRTSGIERVRVDPEIALACLSRVLVDPPEVAHIVATIDWSAYLPRYAYTPDIFAEIDAGHPVGDKQAATVDPARTLSRIWTETLNHPTLTIDDRFDDLGGDSLSAIEIAVAAEKSGLPVTATMVQQLQTIRGIVQVLDTAPQPRASRSIVAGEAGLLPTQQRSLLMLNPDGQLIEPRAFTLPGSIDVDDLGEWCRELWDGHAALRSRFEKSGNGEWRLFLDQQAQTQLPLSWYDVSSLATPKQDEAIAAVVGDVLSGFRLREGQLCRLALIERGDNSRLLVVMSHHIISDQTSQFLLLQDLMAGCEALGRGLWPNTRHTTGVDEWARALKSDYLSGRFHTAVEMVARQDSNLRDWQPPPSGSHRQFAPFHLDIADAARLLARAQVLGVSADDLLAAAVAHALAQWSDRETVGFEWLSRGRSFSERGIDLSRTLGALFCEWPHIIHVGRGTKPTAVVDAVRRWREKDPLEGVGYSYVTYCSSEPELRQRLQSSPLHTVRVNHLGERERFDALNRFDGLNRVRLPKWRDTRKGQGAYDTNRPIASPTLFIGMEFVDGGLNGSMGLLDRDPTEAVRLARLMTVALRSLIDETRLLS